MFSTLLRLVFSQRTAHGRFLHRKLVSIRTYRRRQLSRAQYNLQRQEYYGHLTTATDLQDQGKVSIIVPCFNTRQKYFEPLLASVFAQGYEDWELVLVDASTDQKIAEYIEAKSQHDTRIVYKKIENQGIARNTNQGIALATGEFIAFLDHDDTLDPNALSETVSLFSNNPVLSLVYSDEDKVSEDGERYFEAHFKPDFSPDMLRNVNYITHFVVAKKELVKDLQGIREGFDGAQDYDFLLRAADEGADIGHVPKILYHWREAEGSTAADFSNKEHVTDAGVRALDDHYERNGIKNVSAYSIANRPGFYGATYKLDKKTKRKIWLDFSHTNLTPMEQEYLLEKYRHNKDVVKYNIVVGTDGDNADSLISVKGAVVPKSADTDIAGLFGLCEEKNVKEVSPKITSQKRIYDMGSVHSGGKRVSLFKELDPAYELSFGSLEWVRNVDETSRLVCATTARDNSSHGRSIIWSHSEFILYRSENTRVESTLSPSYFNPNIRILGEYVIEHPDYLEDKVDIKQ
jgi:glycosyltransferase involved in cell wall biosynthesis